MSATRDRAFMLFDQQRYELAERDLRQVLAQDPGDPTAHALLALCLSERERFNEAEAEARVAVGRGPDLAFVHYALSRVLHDRNRLDEATVAVHEAIRQDPENEAFFTLLGTIHYDERRWPQALEAADQALALDPDYSNALNLRALVLRKLGRDREAAETIDGALARDPEGALTHANRGWGELQRGNPAGALESFREALRLDPTLETAREGTVEALKARHAIYRVLLKYFTWMGKLSRRDQWVVLVGGYFAVRGLRSVAAENSALAPILWPLIGAYVLFALMTWIGPAVFDTTLRFNRFGRLALSDEERLQSTLVSSALLFAAAATIVFLVTGAATAAAGIFTSLLVSIPIAATFRTQRGWPRTAMMWYTIGLAVLGAVVILLVAWSEWRGSNDDLGWGLFFLFLFAAFAAQWIGNWLAGVRPKR
ncbi:MAG TPA: tetratricopeptide repeat protein [Gemmatimonadales bacterium]|nr:tetratricopeptide repeat protein [Gemmatimonadales bacterium]